MLRSFLGTNQYSLKTLKQDVQAGVIVGIISIPLGMAFAIASGVNPEYGLYTTIIAGFLVAIFGGSNFQIAGPTGAFIPVLLVIVLQYGYDQLLVAGLMAGVLMFLFGVFKLGNLVTFIPRPVIIGFTSGIAVIIFTGQIDTFLGLANMEQHETFLLNMREIWVNMHTINMYSILVALICLVAIFITRRYMKSVPSVLVGIVVSTVIASVWFDGKVDTIGTLYGSIPNGFPAFQIPDVSLSMIISLLGPALIIASLGSIESLLSCVVADSMTGERHNSNKELRGQGIANMITPLFGGIPATGAIARTATNIKSGARTKLSGVVHSLFVLLTLVLFAPYASAIPLAGLAPILMIVAWNMSERHHFGQMVKAANGDSMVLIVTFLLTVFTNLTLAVGCGILLAMLLFVIRIGQHFDVSTVSLSDFMQNNFSWWNGMEKQRSCPPMHIVTMKGPLFFGSANKLEKHMASTLKLTSNVVIIRMGNVPIMDTTGENMLADIITDYQKHRKQILISDIRPQPFKRLQRSGLSAQIGTDHFFERTEDAIDYALNQVTEAPLVDSLDLAVATVDNEA